MDILGFILIGTATGIGGGTVRDLLLNVPVFWVREPFYIYICIGSCVFGYFAASRVEIQHRWMLWLDAAGLASFCVIGTQISLGHDVAPVIAVVTGVMSATFGGVIRDVLCNENLTLMQPEIYITCAILGASMMVILSWLDIDQNIAIGLSFLAAFTLRMAAITFKLTMPKYSHEK